MSRRIAAKITGVSGYVPPRIMSNAELEKLVDTNDAWIRERTGIRERHVVDPGVATSDLATAAARILLDSRGVPAEDIDLIVVHHDVTDEVNDTRMLHPMAGTRSPATRFPHGTKPAF